MWPILLKWGPVTLHTYGALLAAGFLAGISWMVRLGRRNGLSEKAVNDLSWIVLFGILGARTLYVLFNFRDYAPHPIDVLKVWEGGLVWYGGLLTSLAAGWWWTRRHGVSPARAADVAAGGAALGHAIGRLGCFATGCCYGRVTDVPWAVRFTHPATLAPAGIPLHPSQLYEAALNFALFGALAFYTRRPGTVGTGRPALFYLAGYGVIRLAVESTRADHRGPVLAGLTSTQWVAVATIVITGTVWLVQERRRAGAKL